MATVTFYRLVKTTYAGNAFDGFGARTYGGRWNSVGNACVYLGSSRALCVLESLVHLTIADLSHNYSMLSLDIPEALIAELDKAALPDGWQDDPAPASTKEIGDGWLSSTDNGLVLKVPSTITGEWNALFNPRHPAASAALNTVQRAPFYFDPRFALK
ncbi:RES family NAD+ phosphorylase [Nissabacter archeti]|uniref:RES family NAD+ phosphorylase n=1 Tax=Nissabacter archeti TaxID=1917880 RepID=A0ABS5JFD1_9GAMM|nr:RES family NAD+ phosphorylase [Nissabacter archeti]MBS0968662.1 RES family NAD+ phosphorylase [Nissabacter archeti]